MVKKIALCLLAVCLSNFIPQSFGADKGVDSFAREQMQKAKIPGMEILVMQGSKVLKKQAYGQANVQLDAPMKTSTLVQIASTTKIFTGIAVALLEQRKMLSLDDPVGRFLPELPASWKQVTLRQLAAHISGLPDVLEAPDSPLSAAFQRRSDKEALAYAESKPLDAKPGEKYSYNQNNYLLLKMTIEKVSGIGFEEFVHKNIIDPLGMKSTRWGDCRAIVAGRADLYSTVGDLTYLADSVLSNMINLYVYPSYMSPAAGLNTSVDDLVQLGAALAEGKILSFAEQSRMWEASHHADGTAVDIAKEAGLPVSISPVTGWYLIEHQSRKHPAVFAHGGLATAAMYFPEDKLTVAVLTNLQGADPMAFADGIAAFYIKDLELLSR